MSKIEAKLPSRITYVYNIFFLPTENYLIFFSKNLDFFLALFDTNLGKKKRRSFCINLAHINITFTIVTAVYVLGNYLYYGGNIESC